LRQDCSPLIIGPNHVLPTGGSARFTSGLSVLTFLKLRTYLRSGVMLDSAVIRDTAAFAQLEGLTAHGEVALQREVLGYCGDRGS
jgi:histidinol dehydrogenase